MASPNVSADELAGRVLDVLAVDDELLKKAICLYALRECSYRVADDLAAAVADQISRRPVGEAGAGSVGPGLAIDEQKNGGAGA